ncbi:putative DNA polymerase [Parapoxvirus red deer/HL953]|uniref:DNA polymerase n=1 Tax=Parapoxvirus red deer/HL953 TaxID=1579460 RepID=A0A0A7MEQ6_9POXV|nr:putative DNA polymerase [Parapoxvirus red deer/HL953]AIZ77276.1 putative DNA polymerase [Parapoxvirus red deer/HL953]
MVELKCLNWFENRSNDSRFLFLKARCSRNSVVYLRFVQHFYYVVRTSSLRDIAQPLAWTRDLGPMTVVSIDEIVARTARVPARAREETELSLIASASRLSLPETFMSDFLNVSWFFVAHDIDPDGCYRVDLAALQDLGNGCFHCEDPGACFAEKIPRFNVTKSCLFLDIECHFEKKFPSVFRNPVSHISFCVIDKDGVDRRFTLTNAEMLSADDLAEAERRGLPLCEDVAAVRFDAELTLCPEATLLRVAKRLLEMPLDFVVSFNGHNFDLRYLDSRLALLTGEHIRFRLPDGSETVNFCVYERTKASHKGVGGVSSTTFHINNNNGTIFFDIYAFIQRTEKLDSYKLDAISKNCFHCSAVVEDTRPGATTFRGDRGTDRDGNAAVFARVLATGNYVTVDERVCRVLHKRVADGAFYVELEDPAPRAPGDPATLSFGKDDVSLADMYAHYSLDVCEDMARYCLHDACLCLYLWEHYGVETKIAAAASTYLLPQSVVFEYRASTCIKGPLMRLLLENRTVMVRADTKSKYCYEGGRVMAPKQKMHDKHVLIFDYNSLYPNVCIYANLSPETLVGVVVSDNRLDAEIAAVDIRRRFPAPRYIAVPCEPRAPEFVSEVAIFDREAKGIIPMLLRSFLDARAKYKNLMKSAETAVDREIYNSMQYTYKITANSVYGLMGFRNSALFSYASAKSCTAIGRAMIVYLERTLDGASVCGSRLTLAAPPDNPLLCDEAFAGRAAEVEIDPAVTGDRAAETVRFRSVYGDTDSVFLEVGSVDIAYSRRVGRCLERVINEYVLFENFKVEFEAVYCNLIMQSKKKYTTTKFSVADGGGCERVSKGTSETRRDVAPFHKFMIRKYKDMLCRSLAEDGARNVCVEILRALEDELTFEFETRTVPLEWFLLSRVHHKNFKSPDNPNIALVARYNAANAEAIEIGERYHFAYVCEEGPWRRRLTNIKSFERVVDKAFRLEKNERVMYEVYFKRLCTEIVNLLDNKTMCTLFFEKMFGCKPVFTG